MRRFNCVLCGSTEIRREPAVDEDAQPTGLDAVYCAVCGYHYGDFTPDEIEGRIEVETPAWRLG